MSSLITTWPYKKPPTVSTQSVGDTYTPPNWSKQTPQLYAITYRVPVSSTDLKSASSIVDIGNLPEPPLLVMNTNEAYAGYNAETRTVMLVFDGVKRAQHSQIANVTQHPLQSGYNISDHIVKQPARFTLEVAMSDAIASYTLAGYTPMWKMNISKSVSAYQQMEGLMINRQLVTINTRLETYDNMALIDIQVEDSAKTYFGGLAMTLSFQEVFISEVSISYESVRIQASGETTQGTVQPQVPSKTVVDQHKVGWGTPSAPLITVPGIIPGAPILSDLANWIARGAKIPGAGNWTSNIITSQFFVLPPL